MGQSWKVEKHAGLEGLRFLESHWDALAEEMPERAWHHSYASHRAYFDNLSSPDRFVGLALRDGAGRLRALCPFEERDHSILGVRTRVWELPWDKHTRIRDVICPPDEARAALLPQVREYLRRTRGAPTWAILARVTERGAAWRCLEALPEAATCRDPHGATDVVDTTLSSEEHDRRRSRKFRANLRRAYRKLDEIPDARFVHATRGSALEEEFAAFLELEASGWKGDEGTGTAILMDPSLKGFYEHLISAFPGAEVTSLYAGQTCLASLLCARSGRDYAILKVCYNEDYSTLSPGKLLMDNVLQRCVRDDWISTYNLVSHWSWCQDWKPDIVPAYSVYLTANRTSHALMLKVLRARFRYGPVAKRLLRSLRRTSHGGR